MLWSEANSVEERAVFPEEIDPVGEDYLVLPDPPDSPMDISVSPVISCAVCHGSLSD